MRIHELARLFRPVVEGCYISNSHLGWIGCGLRAVSRLECEVVPLRFFEILFQPRFFLQELIIRISKVERLIQRADWLACVRWLPVRLRYCHSGTCEVFRNWMEGYRGDRGVELEFGLCTELPRDSGAPHGIDSRHWAR